MWGGSKAWARGPQGRELGCVRQLVRASWSAPVGPMPLRAWDVQRVDAQDRVPSSCWMRWPMAMQAVCTRSRRANQCRDARVAHEGEWTIT